MLRRSVFGVRTAAALASSAFQPRRQQSSGGRQQPPGGRGGVQRGDAQAAERDLRARQQMEQMQRMQAEQQQQRGAPDEEEDFNPEPPKKPENSQYVKVEEREGGIKVLRMCRAPVNSLNLEFFQELCDWFMWLASEEAGTKAVVLTSGVKTVFSAGLDINELNKPEPQRFGDFWTLFQETWLLMNAFPLPLIACVNGNAPAGGCILAMCCDYRVMARASVKDPANPKPYRIGLNETKLGIVAPPWVMKSLAYTIGERQAEKMLVLGETPTADEALKIGLVDRVEEEADVEVAALQEAARFAAIPSNARWMSKDLMRQELVSFFPTEKERQYDTEFFGRMIQEPSVVENVSKYLARLGGSKKQ